MKHLLVKGFLACGAHPTEPSTDDIDKVTCRVCVSFAPPGVKKRERVVSDPDVSEPSFQSKEPSEAFYG